MMNFRAYLTSFLLTLLLPFSVLAEGSLAEHLENELGDSPTQAQVIAALKKFRPTKHRDIQPEDVQLPKKYGKILFGDKAWKFIESAQNSNPFVQEEAAKYGYETSNGLNGWAFNPNQGKAIFLPHFVMPKDGTQVGYIQPDLQGGLAEHVYAGDSGKASHVPWWIFPENMQSYYDFIEGGARGAPARGYGLQWNYIAIAFNSPRSLLAIDIENPDRGLVHIKVNLHKGVDGHSRVIQAKKAPRTVETTMLFEEVPVDQRARGGYDVLPEVASYALPFSQRSVVVRDPTKLFAAEERYAYGYEIFSPAGVDGKIENILAYQWMTKLGGKSRKNFEAVARKVFAKMAQPFAFNSLVTGIQIEWHSANWMVNANDMDGPVFMQDLESSRIDAELRLRAGVPSSSFQHFDKPYENAKFSSGAGYATGAVGPIGGPQQRFPKVDFIGTQYLRHVQGVVYPSNYTGPTNDDHFEGFSTIVDAARHFGRDVLGYDLENAEVDRWMQEEMAKAFNDVLRDELNVPKEAVADVTAEQIDAEVKRLLRYLRKVKRENIDAEVKNTRAWVRENGGLSRARYQLRQYYNGQITRADADPAIQDLLRAEVERLTAMRRNSIKLYSNLHSKSVYFIFHQDSRQIEIRKDNADPSKRFVGLASLQPDDTEGTQKFLNDFAAIKGFNAVTSIQSSRQRRGSRGSVKASRAAVTMAAEAFQCLQAISSPFSRATQPFLRSIEQPVRFGNRAAY